MCMCYAYLYYQKKIQKILKTICRVQKFLLCVSDSGRRKFVFSSSAVLFYRLPSFIAVRWFKSTVPAVGDRASYSISSSTLGLINILMKYFLQSIKEFKKHTTLMLRRNTDVQQ